MFNVIEPQEHHLYLSSIHKFLQELSIAVNFTEDEDLANVDYILVEEEIQGLQGGILLVKKPLGAVCAAVRTYLETMCPQYQLCSEIWTGRIAFYFSKEISGWDYERISKLLYRSLFEDLIAFGVKENAPFLCLTMPLVEYLSINLLSLWDFMFEVRPRESYDGLFHGILSLARPTRNTSFTVTSSLQEIEECGSSFYLSTS